MANEPERDNLDDILKALRHEQASVREQAMQRLQVYANSAGGATENEALTEAESLEAWGEARKKIMQQSRIVEALLIAIDDPSIRLRSGAALLLGDATIPEAQEALIRHVRTDPVNHVRMMCVAALEWTPDSAQKFEGFLSALQDPHYQVVFPASISLGKIGDKQAIEPLRAVLTHPSWQVRFYSCEALVRLQAVDERVVNLLEELNEQPEAEEHNDMSFTVAFTNLFSTANEPTAARAQTTQEVLDQARRALQ